MTTRRSILVVEDEEAIAQLIRLHLEHQGYEVIVAGDGREALAAIASAVPSLAVLDLMLPDMDGLEVLEKLRAAPATARLPVILLTARAEEADRILGLEVGADDYVVKPFSPRELMLRVGKLIASREDAPRASAPTVFGRLEVDEDRFRVTVDRHPLEISATEMRLLLELMRCRGRVLSRSQLLENAWGYMPNVTERTVDTHVKRLRQKLGPVSFYLETVRGVGYRWVEEPAAAEAQAGAGPLAAEESE